MITITTYFKENSSKRVIDLYLRIENFAKLLFDTSKDVRISRLSAVPPAMILRRSFSTRGDKLRLKIGKKNKKKVIYESMYI